MVKDPVLCFTYVLGEKALSLSSMFFWCDIFLYFLVEGINFLYKRCFPILAKRCFSKPLTYEQATSERASGGCGCLYFWQSSFAERVFFLGGKDCSLVGLLMLPSRDVFEIILQTNLRKFLQSLKM